MFSPVSVCLAGVFVDWITQKVLSGFCTELGGGFGHVSVEEPVTFWGRSRSFTVNFLFFAEVRCV